MHNFRLPTCRGTAQMQGCQSGTNWARKPSYGFVVDAWFYGLGFKATYFVLHHRCQRHHFYHLHLQHFSQIEFLFNNTHSRPEKALNLFEITIQAVSALISTLFALI
jgi:hypothetical protein